jgi:hypothetical protein
MVFKQRYLLPCLQKDDFNSQRGEELGSSRQGKPMESRRRGQRVEEGRERERGEKEGVLIVI